MLRMPSYGAAVGSDANAAGGTVTQAPKDLEQTLDDIQTMSEGVIVAIQKIRVDMRSRPHPAPTDEQCRICSRATARKAREQVLDEMIKLSMMVETNETERWETCGRPKNDGYINGSHSGYCHALRDMRQWIDRIKKAESLREQQGGEP